MLDKTQTLFIADKEKHHYQLLFIGQDKQNAYYLWVLTHLQLKEDGKVWILENRTEHDIAAELVASGLLPSDIVIGLLPERIRQHTEYAIH